MWRARRHVVASDEYEYGYETGSHRTSARISRSGRSGERRGEKAS